MTPEILRFEQRHAPTVEVNPLVVILRKPGSKTAKKSQLTAGRPWLSSRSLPDPCHLGLPLFLRPLHAHLLSNFPSKLNFDFFEPGSYYVGRANLELAMEIRLALSSRDLSGSASPVLGFKTCIQAYFLLGFETSSYYVAQAGLQLRTQCRVPSNSQ